MKFSMEKMYVPVASNDEKRDMMSDWKQTSRRVRDWSMICAVVTGFFALLLRSYGDDFFFIPGAVALILLLSAYPVQKWWLSGYTCVIIAVALGFTRLLLPLPDKIFLLLAVVVGIFLPLIPCFFAFRCIYNYNEVFLELKKFKEFPDFIQNTADMYGEKIYLKEKDKNQFDNKYQASYNPFNTQADIYREEFLRSQQAGGKMKLIKKVVDIDVNKDSVRNTPDAVKHKTAFGYEWKICHCDLNTASPEERKLVADKWRENTLLAEHNYSTTITFMAFCVFAGGFGSLAGMLNFIALIIFTSGITYMKLSNPIAPIISLGALIYVGVCASVQPIGLFLFLGTLFTCRWLFLSIIRFYLNYGTYKQLKSLPGYPSFITTTSDRYGDKMYIAEEPVKPVKNIYGKKTIVMNIGYDEPPKKEDKAWNAFDYMDEQNNSKDEENKND